MRLTFLLTCQHFIYLLRCGVGSILKYYLALFYFNWDVVLGTLRCTLVLFDFSWLLYSHVPIPYADVASLDRLPKKVLV